jgi:selenocysteine lyase/cysteine desulfurase
VAEKYKQIDLLEFFTTLVSIYLYNTKDEVDALVDAIDDARQLFA